MKQSPFFEKLNTAGKSLAKLAKRKKVGIEVDKLEIKRRCPNKH